MNRIIIAFALIMGPISCLTDAMQLASSGKKKFVDLTSDEKLTDLMRHTSGMTSGLINPEIQWTNQRQQEFAINLQAMRNRARILALEFRQKGNNTEADLLIEADLIGGEATEVASDLQNDDCDRTPALRSSRQRLINILSNQMGEVSGVLRAVEAYRRFSGRNVRSGFNPDPDFNPDSKL